MENSAAIRATGDSQLGRPGAGREDSGTMNLQKDQILDRLASKGNVAQFVAFRPGPAGLAQSFSRLRGLAPNMRFASVAEAVEELLRRSGGMVNVRSYVPHDPRSREFLYGLTQAETVVAALERLAAEGLHLIVNETIDISDGGVSGVVQGGLVEFAPDDTPRCVEKPGVTSLPYEAAMTTLELVYGFRPTIATGEGQRTEFSVHPDRRGWRGEHVILWEHEEDVPGEAQPALRWPNRFSRVIGDKTFGLLMAHVFGFAVPHTLAIGRRIAPFWFGTPTGSAEVWTRTCPFEPHPGYYTTLKGWTDPYRLLAAEDPGGNILAAVLRQDAVPAAFSGAAIVRADGGLTVEGLAGEGDAFMLGTQTGERLPRDVIEDVEKLFAALRARFGPVRFEWVHDGTRVWLIQLHLGATVTTAAEVVPGDANEWKIFDVADGLEALRTMLRTLPIGDGIMLRGEVGLTSHVADVLRRAGAPARIEAPNTNTDPNIST
jgi:hypothetical protein